MLVSFPRYSPALSQAKQPTFASAALENKLEKLIDVNMEMFEHQKQQLKVSKTFLSRQNEMGFGSGLQFWWNRLVTQGSVALPIGFISGVVSGAVIPFFAKLFASGSFFGL